MQELFLTLLFFCFLIFSISLDFFESGFSLSSNSLRARMRFIALDLSFWNLTIIPVGKCFNWTTLLDLFIFWPPRPPPCTNFSSISERLTPNLRIKSRISLYLASVSWDWGGNFISFVGFRIQNSAVFSHDTSSQELNPDSWFLNPLRI